MWIIPKPITSAFVPDTEALISDLGEQSHAFAQSLIQRSKVTPAPTWLRRLRQDSWMQLLSGRMLRRSRSRSFIAAYRSSLVVIHASRSHLQESDLGETTPATSGPGSQMELMLCAPPCASSRTSKDTLPLGCVTSSTTWESWVTERRGAYSRRLKSALLTRGRESSSWPTPDTCSRGDGPSQSSRHTPTLQTQVKHWPTANSRDWKDSGATQGNRMSPNLGTVVHRAGQLGPVNGSNGGNRQGQWATPRAGKTTDENPETWAKRQEKGDVATMPLTAQVKQGSLGKLNPRWVETLMGVPVGWTMATCSHPLVIGPMNSGFLEMASSPPQQHSLSQPS